MRVPKLRRRKLRCSDRLKRLALELTTATAQILREDYGFTAAEASTLLAKVTARAKQNRNNLETIGAVEEIKKAMPYAKREK